MSLQDLNSYKKQGLTLLTKMGESVKYVTGGYKQRARPLEFAAMGDYLDIFTQKLGTIDRIAQRIIKEQSGKANLLGAGCSAANPAHLMSHALVAVGSFFMVCQSVRKSPRLLITPRSL